MSYSDSFPTQRPILNLVFSGGSDQLDSRISFSRADSTPSNVHYRSNESHLSSENLITQSQFSGWTKLVSPTVTAAYTNGPNGSSNTATRLQSASGADRYFYTTETSWTSGQQYTVSCWVKSNTGVAQTFAFFLPTTPYASADLTTHATDWTRITATFTAATSSIYCGFKLLSANTTDLSIWGFQVNTGANALDYQATSGQIHRSYSSTLKSVATSGQPRFEYSATDGQSVGSGTALGLLVESQATNLARYSSDISSWNSTSTVTLTSNAGIAPNGQLEADLIVFPSTVTQHYVYDNTISLTSGTTYTTSVYVKSAGQRYFQLCGNSSGWGYNGANFDLEAVTSSNVGTATSTITAVGDGYYRLTVTMAATSTMTGGVILINVSSLSAAHFPATAGNDYDGVLCWGFQTEVGSSASSIISTSGAAATKSADSCSVDLSSFYTGGEVSGIVEAKNIGTPYPTLATLTDSTANQRILLQGNDAGTYVSSSIVTDGAVVAAPTSALTAASSKVGFRCDTDDFGTVVNGGTVATDTSGTQPATMTTLHIGQKQDGNFQVNGHIGRLSLYSAALSNLELQSLTSNP